MQRPKTASTRVKLTTMILDVSYLIAPRTLSCTPSVNAEQNSTGRYRCQVKLKCRASKHANGLRKTFWTFFLETAEM